MCTKFAYVVPVYKKGVSVFPTKLSSYFLIILIPQNVWKLMVKILTSFVYTNSLLYNYQFGFIDAPMQIFLMIFTQFATHYISVAFKNKNNKPKKN